MNGFIKVVLNQMLINKTLSQLGINNDGQLNLNYTSQLCKRRNQKIHDLTRLNK